MMLTKTQSVRFNNANSHDFGSDKHADSSVIVNMRALSQPSGLGCDPGLTYPKSRWKVRRIRNTVSLIGKSWTLSPKVPR